MSVLTGFRLVCFTISLVLLATRRQRFEGTTLMAPYGWLCLAISSLLTVELLEMALPWRPTTAAAMRYMAATSLFCPLVAVLGARRPLHAGWQFIVVTLWLVLILPVVENMILWQAGTLDEGPARRWFMALLLGVGLGNYLFTRYTFAALLATTGGTLLLLDHLPGAPEAWPLTKTLGSAFLTGGLLVAWLRARPTCAPNWDAVWCDFRDAFGTVWGLRIMERVNATARLGNWTSELTWYGFVPATPDAAEAGEIERTLRTLLRRFVSEAWIDARHEASASSPNAIGK